MASPASDASDWFMLVDGTIKVRSTMAFSGRLIKQVSALIINRDEVLELLLSIISSTVLT